MNTDNDIIAPQPISAADAAAALGRLGGLARAQSTSSVKRSAIAALGGKARARKVRAAARAAAALLIVAALSGCKHLFPQW